MYEITRERKRELDTNAKQTSWFLQKLSSRLIVMFLCVCVHVPTSNMIIEINKTLQQMG